MIGLDISQMLCFHTPVLKPFINVHTQCSTLTLTITHNTLRGLGVFFIETCLTWCQAVLRFAKTWCLPIRRYRVVVLVGFILLHIPDTIFTICLSTSLTPLENHLQLPELRPCSFQNSP